MDALDVLRAFPREVPDQDVTFMQAREKPIWLYSYNKQLRLAAERVGIDRWISSHVLRHTAATLIGSATGSELAVMHFLGQTDTRTSRRYIHGKRNHATAAELALHTALSGEAKIG